MKSTHHKKARKAVSDKHGYDADGKSIQQKKAVQITKENMTLKRRSVERIFIRRSSWFVDIAVKDL